MPIPTVPEAHFILIQAGFPFGFLNALFHRVALTGDKRDARQRTLGWSGSQIIGDLLGIADGATSQQPDIRPRKLISTFHDLLSCPVIFDGAFFSFDHRQAFPGMTGPTGDHLGNHASRWSTLGQSSGASWSSSGLLLWLLLLGSLGPDPRVGRDCQDVETPMVLDRFS